tara:strand:+ start:134 stop:397 length:264 start_codon:yes stop_codon:yes gene_type:complete
MKIQRTEALALNFGNEVYTNTYVSNYSGETELKFHDYQSDGAEFKLNVNVPIETARAIAKELQNDLDNYDAFQAKKAKEAVEEAVEE